MSLDEIVGRLAEQEHGFKHIVEAGDVLLKKDEEVLPTARQLLGDERYQARMLGTYLLGANAATDPEALTLMETVVAVDPNWRVQEMLAKAFDRFAGELGYEASLPFTKNWLADSNPNKVRAVIEGLRIWTARPYFKQHPEVAIALISAHRSSESDYVRKSVGNALRDIKRKYETLVLDEIGTWEAGAKAEMVRKLVLKNG